MGIDHGGGDVLVAEQLLHGANVVAALQQVGGKAVPEGMAACWFAQASGAHGEFDRVLDVLFMDMMATRFAAGWIEGESGGGKDVLPGPGSDGARIFSLQCVGQKDGAAPEGQVLAVQLADAGEVRTERAAESLG